jgi:ribose 5-phosphate isomerase B
MKIYVASDHGGFNRKRKITEFLLATGHSVEDFGPYTLNQEDDYPDYVIPLAKKVASRRNVGIVFCRNGQGVCIATNKVKGIRAVTGFSVKEAKMTRKDDNANVLCIPTDYQNLTETKKIIKVWLKTSFSGKTRHKRRLRKITKIEK